MKLFTNKNVIQKLIIAIVIVTLLNFCIAPMQVHAANIGGILANGIRDLALILPDAFISIAQFAVIGTWVDAVDRESSAYLDTKAQNSDFWQKSVKYPIIQLSPELIFSDEIELLSIDFINGGDKKKDYIIPATGVSSIGSSEEGAQSTANAVSILRVIIASWYVTLRTLAIVGLLSILVYIGIRIIISSTSQDKAKYKQRLVDWLVAFCLLFFMHYIMAGIVTVVNKLDTALSSSLNVTSGIKLNSEYGGVAKGTTARDTANERAGVLKEKLPEILSKLKNEILPSEIIGYKREEKTGIVEWTEARKLSFQKTPKYLPEEPNVDNLKNFDFIKNLSYKEGGSKDGFIQFDFITSYESTDGSTVNVTILTITSKYSQIAATHALGAPGGDPTIIYTYEVVSGSWNNGIENAWVWDGYVSEIKNMLESRVETTSQTEQRTNFTGQLTTVSSPNGYQVRIIDSKDEILYYINYARLYCNADSDHNPEGFGFTAIYIILVVMTIMFLFRYLKRVIYVAFLTLIAPLVALTYPLDKIKDGKAQAFNMWIREYIFNVLIQPFHLLIYGILVGGASALASAYWIYGVVCIAFLIPAEKLMRKFFGFDNAGTLSAAGSFAGGALFSTLVSRLNRPKPQGKNGGQGGSEGGGRDTRMQRPMNTKGQVNADDEFATYAGGGSTPTPGGGSGGGPGVGPGGGPGRGPDGGPVGGPDGGPDVGPGGGPDGGPSGGSSGGSGSDEQTTSTGAPTPVGGASEEDNQDIAEDIFEDQYGNNSNSEEPVFNTWDKYGYRQNKNGEMEDKTHKEDLDLAEDIFEKSYAGDINTKEKISGYEAGRNSDVQAYKNGGPKTAWAKFRGRDNYIPKDLTPEEEKNLNEEQKSFLRDYRKGQRRALAEKAAENRALRRKDMADAFIDNKKRQLKNAVKELPGRAGTAIRRGVVGGLAGGALALTGAAVGAASGDPGAAMKLAAAGAGAGYYGANYYGDRASRTIRDDIKATEPAFWGADYKSHQQEIYDKEMKNSEEYIQAYANAAGGSRTKGKELMKEYAKEEKWLRDHANISDPKMLARSMKLIEEFEKGDRTFNGHTLTREQAKYVVASAADKARTAGASVWENNSHAHRTWVEEERKALSDRGITDPDQLKKTTGEILDLMGNIKFGPSN